MKMFFYIQECLGAAIVGVAGGAALRDGEYTLALLAVGVIIFGSSRQGRA